MRVIGVAPPGWSSEMAMRRASATDAGVPRTITVLLRTSAATRAPPPDCSPRTAWSDSATSAALPFFSVMVAKLAPPPPSSWRTIASMRRTLSA